MKECLWCKKEFQEKKPTAKYCSTSCRVMFNHKRGKLKGKVRDDVIITMMTEMNNKLMTQIENASFPPMAYPQGLKGIVPAVEQNNGYKPPKITRSAEQWHELKRACESAEEWATVKYQIQNAENLSEKQKQTIINTP